MARILPLMLLCVLLLLAPSAHAKPKITCEVQKVAQHSLLVTFAWKARITSDKAWDACDLSISFLDAKGGEVYIIRERLKLKVGENDFEGHGICETAIWQRIRKYITTLDCVF